MSRGVTRKQVLGEFRTSEIVAAAKQVIAAKGFAAATMDEIAEAAGIAKGTIYLYFKSKDQLFQAVAADILARLIERIKHIRDLHLSAREKLGRILRVMLESLEAEQAMFRVYVSEFPCLLSPADDVRPSVTDLDREFTGVLADVVAEGGRTGEFAAPAPLQVAYALRGLARGLAIGKLVEGSEESLLSHREWLETLVLQGLAHPQTQNERKG